MIETNSTRLVVLKKILAAYPAQHYFVGYSGGRDSHVLLDLLCRLRDRGELTVSMTAIHIHHHLQPQADDWAQHCQCICDAYGVALIIDHVTDKPVVGDSLEAFARQARYRLIEKHLHEGELFLSAHHQRDQAETFLLQLMRGAGLDGLKAMPVVRDLGTGRYLRPLLEVDYAEIVAYAEENQLHFIDDDSNAETRFDRNFLRHDVLPILEKRFPKATANIAQSAKWLAEVPEAVTPKTLMLDELCQRDVITQKQHIRRFIKDKTGLSLSQTQTQYLLTHHLTAQADKHPMLVVDNFVVRRYAGELIVTEKCPDWRLAEQTIKTGEVRDFAPIGCLEWQAGEGIVCDEPLMLKPLCCSDKFHPHTRQRATSVKKLLNEAKIPAWLRGYYFGLYLHNELIAIPNIGVCRAHYQKNVNAHLPQWLIKEKFVRM